MRFHTKGIKALEFESGIDSTWYSMKTNYDKTLITELLERCGIGFDREDIMDWGNYGVTDIISKYGLEETIKGFKSYVPSNMENVWGDDTEVTCLCEDCDYYKEKDDRGWLSCYTYFGSCWEDLVIFVTEAVMIGGDSAKREIEEQWGLSRIWIDRICDNQCGWFEEELYEQNMSIEEAVLKFKKQVYGDDEMFLQKFTELNNNDDLKVFWIDNLMYVNDEHDGQATVTTDLFSAYKFALLINAHHFSYDDVDTSDEDIIAFTRAVCNMSGETLNKDLKCDKEIIRDLSDKYLSDCKFWDIGIFVNELNEKLQEHETLTFKDLLHSLMKEKFNENDNPKIYVEIEKNIEAITEETPYGNIYEITGYRLDDDEDIYLSIE